MKFDKNFKRNHYKYDRKIKFKKSQTRKFKKNKEKLNYHDKEREK